MSRGWKFYLFQRDDLRAPKGTVWPGVPSYRRVQKALILALRLFAACFVCFSFAFHWGTRVPTFCKLRFIRYITVSLPGNSVSFTSTVLLHGRRFISGKSQFPWVVLSSGWRQVVEASQTLVWDDDHHLTSVLGLWRTLLHCHSQPQGPSRYLSELFQNPPSWGTWESSYTVPVPSGVQDTLAGGRRPICLTTQPFLRRAVLPPYCEWEASHRLPLGHTSPSNLGFLLLPYSPLSLAPFSSLKSFSQFHSVWLIISPPRSTAQARGPSELGLWNSKDSSHPSTVTSLPQGKNAIWSSWLNEGGGGSRAVYKESQGGKNIHWKSKILP